MVMKFNKIENFIQVPNISRGQKETRLKFD